MKIKLKKEVLSSGGLCSSGSHQCFPTMVWAELNAGKTVEVDEIPDRCKDKIETVSSSSKSSSPSSSQSPPSSSSSSSGSKKTGGK